MSTVIGDKNWMGGDYKSSMGYRHIKCLYSYSYSIPRWLTITGLCIIPDSQSFFPFRRQYNPTIWFPPFGGCEYGGRLFYPRGILRFFG